MELEESEKVSSPFWRLPCTLILLLNCCEQCLACSQNIWNAFPDATFKLFYFGSCGKLRARPTNLQYVFCYQSHYSAFSISDLLRTMYASVQQACVILFRSYGAQCYASVQVRCKLANFLTSASVLVQLNCYTSELLRVMFCRGPISLGCEFWLANHFSASERTMLHGPPTHFLRVSRYNSTFLFQSCCTQCCGSSNKFAVCVQIQLHFSASELLCSMLCERPASLRSVSCYKCVILFRNCYAQCCESVNKFAQRAS